MSERTGKRDSRLGERHKLWGIPLPSASSLSVPPPISKRHHRYGNQIQAVDLDFPLIEYTSDKLYAIMDYKWALSLEDLGRLSKYTSTNHALGNVYTKEGEAYKSVPFCAVLYRTDPWVFRVIPMNDEADSRLWGRSPIYSELLYVQLLYDLRDIPFPAPLARLLNTYLPPKKEVAECEPLNNLIADVAKVALFDEEGSA